MKKLLSICFLSMLLVLAGFTAKAQTNCCFWLENLQPDTVQDVSNLGMPGTAALLPGHGNALVLNNTLNRVDNVPFHYGEQDQIVFDRTDWFRVHMSGNCANPDDLVSLEWILYKDGVAIPTEQLHNFADIYIYTKYDQIANNGVVDATCGHMQWLGGHVYKPGVCEEVHNNCDGGYPGALADVDNTHPYGFASFISAGYTPLSYYNFDAFRYSFFSQTETRMAITWKQIGNYSLVVRLRQRTQGGAGVGEGFQNIGSNGTCCGPVIATDSLSYLTNTTSQKAVCAGDVFTYGNPAADYSVQGNYNVLFGTYTCDHWEVDSIDLFSFYTRTNPNIVARNLIVCKNELVTNAQFAELAPAVNTDAQGYVSHTIKWRAQKANGTWTEWSENIPAHATNVPGVYNFEVQQCNQYDAVTGEEFECCGEVAAFTMTVRDVLPPVLHNTADAFEFCYSELPENITLKAKLNNTSDNDCADNIHWFEGLTATGTPVATSSTFEATVPAGNNVDRVIKYTAFSIDESTETYSTTGVTVTINVWKNPVLVAKPNVGGDSIVKCPNTENIALNSNFNSTNFNAADLTWNYSWTKNGARIAGADAANYTVVAPGCGQKDVYEVTAVAESEHGCRETITRRFTVEGSDVDALSIAWRNNATAQMTINGCDTANLFEGFAWAAPYTIADAEEGTTSTSAIKIVADHCSNAVTAIYTVDVNTTAAPCSTVVTRNYKLVDECGNESNTISQVVTIVNNQKPAINGQLYTMEPVRPLHNDCKSNLPVRAALLAAFHDNFTTTTGCDAAVADDDIHFFMGNTTVVADGNTDIFAETAQVTVYAQITDACGNISAKVPVFVLNKPADLEIAHGAIYTPDYEFCNTETAHVVFDPLMIHNGLAPYVYTWSQTPVPAECGMTVADNGVEIDVWALNGGAYNTSAQFIMTVEDAYGCVTTDTSNAIRWFGIPDVTIIEAYNNDDYAHAAPVVVCPTFGHYLLTTVDHSNLPIAENQNLTYAWSGEAIDFTSTTKNSFIAVNENICDREYTAYVEVTNAKGCKATASYSINVKDTVAPVITLNMPTDTITNMTNCKIIVPDYTTLFNASTVSDECWTMDSIKVTQSIAAGTQLAENTDVVITVAPKCGPTASYTIKACFPEPRIATEIVASVDSSCFPYTTNFTANTVNFTAPLNIYWDGAAVSAENKEFTTTSETAGLAHHVRVVDANGCEATASYTLVVYHTPVATDVTLSSTPNHYCDAEHFDGTFTVTSANNEIDGVRLNGETEWHTLPYTETVADGTYKFDLHTIHGCVSEAIAEVTVSKDTVDANLALNLAIITDNANCTAPWSGTIEVTNPAVGYEYHVSAGLENSGDETIIYNTAMLNSVRFNFLYQGDYTVTVVSPFNCRSNAEITVEDHRHTPELPTNTVVANTNCVNPNGTITLNNTNTDYWYTINGLEIRGNNGSIFFENLSAGEYTLTVANKYTRCSNTMVIAVPDNSNAPSMPEVTVNPNTYCVGSNGSINYLSSPAMQYTLTDASENVVASTGLAAGTYTLTVFDPATGCASNGTYTINDAPVMPIFTATEVETSPRTSCDVTLADGEINITEANGYAYVVKNSADEVVANLSTLDSGVYVVYKTNVVTGCVASEEVHVGYDQPELNWSVSASKDKDCSDEIGTGAITVLCTTPATFTVMNSDNEAVAMTGLNPDLYTVTATVTATGCSYTDTVRVASDYTYPIINATATANYMCNVVKNGTITFNDVNTHVNYNAVTYTVDNEVVTSPMTALNDGLYTINAVTDYHCTAASLMIEVEDSAFVITEFAVVPNSVCNPTASKPGNGQIRVLTPQSEFCDYIFTDLTPSHHYDVDHFEPIDYTKYTLEDGWYLVQITDTRTGCVSKDSVYVPYQPIAVTIDALTSTPDYICNENAGNGTINVHAVSASQASVLAYSIDGGNTYNTTGSFSNVKDGEYHIVVMDTVTRCIYDALADADITVEQGQYKIAVEYNNVANNACDASLYNGEVHATVTYADATLGTGDFTVAIAGNSFTGLNGGNYVLTITDNNTGCVYNDTATVLNDNEYTPEITVSAYNRNLNTEDYHFCFGQNNAYLVAEATTDLAGDNFSYLWRSSCDHLTDSTHARVDVYTQQNYCCTYTVFVKSLITGCENQMNVKVCIDTLPVIRFNATGESISLVSMNPNATYQNCENNAFTMCVADPGFKSIEWTNGYTGSEACFTIDANTLTPGSTSYCVRVVDFNGCASGPQAVNVTTLPIATGADTIYACNSYDFVGNRVADQNFNYTVAGPNTFTVVDTLNAVNGCDSIVTYTIILSTDPTLNDTLTLAASYCAGESIIAEGTGYEVSDAVVAGWRIVAADAVITNDNFNTTGVAFDPTAALTYDMNGKKIYAYAANGCDTLYERAHTLVVNDIPTLAVEDKTLAPDTICLGGAFEYETPAAADINWHGSVGTTKVQYSTDGTTWTDVTAPIVPTVAGNNYQIRFVADNACTEDYIVLDGPVAMVVNDTVKLAADTINQVICLGNAIETITITNAFSTVTVADLPAGLTFNADNTITGTPEAAGTFNYTIKAESTCGCEPKEIKGTITVKDSIKLSITNAEQTVCLGEPIETVGVSTANGSIRFTTDVTSYGLTVSGTSVSGTPTFIGTKTVVFTVFDPNHVCASKKDTVVITVNDTVKLDFVDATLANQTVCLGSDIADIEFDYENATVEVSTLPAGLTFDATTNTISGAPVAADTINYTITATSNNGCTDYDKTIKGIIIVNDTVKLSATNLDQAAFCLGNEMDTVVITAENADVTVTGLPAGVTYDPATLTFSGSPVAADTVTYTITATSNATPSCGVKTLTGVLMVSDTVTLSATGLAQTAICLGQPIADIAIEATNATVTVDTLPAGVTFNNETNTISGTPEVAGTFAYVIKATSVNGCTEKTINDTIVVNDTVKLTTVSTLNQVVCKNSEIDTITFEFANATLSVDTVLPGLVFDAENGIIAGAPTVMPEDTFKFVVTANSNAVPACESKSVTLSIVVNDAPEINSGIIGSLEVCVGQVFSTPTAPTIADIDSNGTAITAMTWIVDSTEMDWTAPSTLAQDGKTLYFIATNACGTDTVEATLTVHDLPVPEIVSDTIVCNDGVANLSATAGYASYQWYKDGATITGATSATYDYTAEDGEGTYTFTVEVVDANGCTSVANTNATVDTRTFSVDDAVTVVVTGKPHFIFTHEGAETHEFDANTADAQTNYTWMVSNPCEYNPDELVFVNFDIYFNGELIDDDSIGLYITEDGTMTNRYVTRDSINWNAFSGTPMNATCYYNYAQSNMTTGYYQSNHYPAGNYGFSGNTKYDDLYLHFLAERPVYKTVNKFRRAGEYKIVYTLMSTSNSHPNGHQYNNGTTTPAVIGGYDAVVSSAHYDTLAYDVLTINVEGEDNLAATPSMTPAPVVAEVDGPTMTLYPNPATSANTVKAHIKGIAGDTKVQVVNLAGKVLAEDAINIPAAADYVYSREISNLAPGVYFIYVKGENATVSRKLVVTK